MGTPERAAAAKPQAFAVAILLAAREKELGLDATPWIDAARTIDSSPDAATYAQIAAALRWNGAERLLKTMDGR